MLCKFWNSTVGKKVTMALTGFVLVGFVVGHMAGNLKTYFGYDEHGVHALDHYAEMLRSIGADFLGHGNFLWLVRGFLLLCLVLHVVAAIQLSIRNRASRPQNYAVSKYSSASMSSRYMALSGLFLLAFIIFHIQHFTIGNLHFDGFLEGQVYRNVYFAFQHGWIVLVYVFAMIQLCIHLTHGMWSAFQTLGIDGKNLNKIIRYTASGLAAIVYIGFISVPITIYLGVLPEPEYKVVDGEMATQNPFLKNENCHK